MVGDLEKSSFSNIEQQSLEFVKYTLQPWIIRLSDGKLMETQTANYFSDIYPIDCAVLSANA